MIQQDIQAAEKLNRLQQVIDDATSSAQAKQQAFTRFQTLNHELYANGQEHDRGSDGTWWCQDVPTECDICGKPFHDDRVHTGHLNIHKGACEDAHYQDLVDEQERERRAERANEEALYGYELPRY